MHIMHNFNFLLFLLYSVDPYLSPPTKPSPVSALVSGKEDMEPCRYIFGKSEILPFLPKIFYVHQDFSVKKVFFSKSAQNDLKRPEK